MAYWLVKSDPETYGWEDFVKEIKTSWDGVRNYQARNNLQLMKKNDLVLFYHSQVEKSVVGIAKVSKESYPDPTINDPKWVSVELELFKKLNNPVSLEKIKATSELSNMAIIRHTRLSVMPVSEYEYNLILEFGK